MDPELAGADPQDDGGERRGTPAWVQLAGLGRAGGGALIFGLPILMTRELWWLGFTADRLHLALLIAVAMPLLVLLSHRLGFEQTFGWRDDLRDALIAVAIGLATSALVLALFGVIAPGMPVDEVVGKLAMQTVPASFGALLGRSQFGESGADQVDPDQGRALAGYGGQLFLMAVGALYLGLSVAPTDEMMLIAYLMTPWHALALVATSIALMHGFIYALAFGGGRAHATGGPWWRDFYRFTVTGYDGGHQDRDRREVVGLPVEPENDEADEQAQRVLAFPAAIGAAAARLIL